MIKNFIAKNDMLFAALGYLLIFIVYTFPFINVINTSLLCHSTINSDAYQYVWNVFNINYQASISQNPFTTSFIFAPVGTSMYMHTYTPVLGFFSFLFHNQILAINSFLIISFVFSGLGAYYLSIQYLNKNYWLAFFVGFAYSFSPFKMARLGEHYHLVLTATMPFLIALSISIIGKIKNKSWPSLADLIGFFALFVVSFLSDYYTTYYTLIFIVFWFSFPYILKIKHNYGYKFWLGLGLIFILSHILTRVLLVWGYDDNFANYWAGDILKLFVPSIHSRYFTFLIGLDLKYFPGTYGTEFIIFVGWALAILFLIAIIQVLNIQKKASEIKYWLIILMVASLVMLPNLKLLDFALLNSPFMLVHFMPFIQQIRCPTRAYLLFSLALLIITAYGLNIFLKNNATKPIAKYLIILLSLFTFFEYFPKPYTYISTKNVPPVHEFLNTLNTKRLMIIPFGLRDGMLEIGKTKPEFLYYQTINKIPMLGGYMSRLDKKVIAFYKSDSVCNQIFRMEADASLILKAPNKALADSFFMKMKTDTWLISPEYRESNVSDYLLKISAYYPHQIFVIDSSLVIKFDN